MSPGFEPEGYERALELIAHCATEHGFLASTMESANYRRVWARDGCIVGLAALVAGREDLVATTRATLLTLARHQGPHGEIPSNVDMETGRVSYGGTTGRVDADLWFVIGCGQYWRRIGDDEFLQAVAPALERVRFLLGAWEFNGRGLLYVPPTGDWADEYLQSGYVLYDQLLYLQAQREFEHLRVPLNQGRDPLLASSIERLERLIAANYWIAPDGDSIPEFAYHEVLYAKGRSVSAEHRSHFWLPFFTATGYGYRFDAFANVLASLLGIADDAQNEEVDATIDRLEDGSYVLPAFCPVITPRDEDWEDLQMNFSYTFKNEPYEFQNHGRWPLLTGFYVADLARRGAHDRARTYLEGLYRANALEHEGRAWSFPEFIHGQEHTPGGTSPLAWSAAAAVLGHRALGGEEIVLGVPRR